MTPKPEPTIVPINEKMALMQIVSAINELTKELKEIKGHLYAISNQLIRGGRPAR